MVSEEQLPLPPREFMLLVGGQPATDLVENFKTTGRVMADMLSARGFIHPGVDFLDIGCGCGRMARHLVSAPLHSYTGFDRNPEMIAWCQDTISPVAPHFKFHFFDLKSDYVVLDSHRGALDAAGFRFPFDDRSFDSVLLASVFTHMPIEESAHYLNEIHRVLRPAGKVMLSVFFTQETPIRKDIDYLYRPSDFYRLLKNTGFRYSRLNPLCFGRDHNWLVLDKREGGPPLLKMLRTLFRA